MLPELAWVGAATGCQSSEAANHVVALEVNTAPLKTH